MLYRAQENKKFIILNDAHESLASANLIDQHGQDKVFELTSTPSCDLLALPSVNILSLNSTEFIAWRGRIQRQKDDRLYFHADERVDAGLRRHLRIQMSFRANLYPVKGRGPRLPVVCRDISCGGIALYSVVPFHVGEVYQIALPCTEPPLLAKIEALRTISEEKRLYAFQFIDLLPQEEAMIQERIFEYDLHHPSVSSAENPKAKVL